MIGFAEVNGFASSAAGEWNGPVEPRNGRIDSRVLRVVADYLGSNQASWRTGKSANVR
jgi:hypothetical protein